MCYSPDQPGTQGLSRINEGDGKPRMASDTQEVTGEV